MNGSQHRPINISKIRAAALLLIMPNSEQRVALPHGGDKRLSRSNTVEMALEAFDMHWIV
ncbi:hypothetical protein CRN75_03610 [Yersinia frederiksenii]|nr:hypothetical protein CRN75_03610 [Yersinia frederiksenii]